jgi:F0F1-type ATP synthase epsilon subunit
MTMRQDASTGQLVDDGVAPSAAAPAGQPTMHVKVYSPYKVYFDSDAVSISGDNATGPFDILPHHHPFISILKACELVVQNINGDSSRIRISGGIMHVKADKVQVFLQV